MGHIRRLSPDEYDELYNALSDALEADAGQTARCGNHFVLIAVLNRLGFSANGSQQAENTAQRILNGQ